jgi:hypothetical protein
MVRAIFAGTKTQTRRVVKPTQTTPKVAPPHMEPYLIELSDGTFTQERDDGGVPCWIGTHPDYPTEDGKWFSCPYGQPGDRLWVKETYAIYGEFKDGTGYCYKADGDRSITWKSSRFMPRAASRITLKLTSVRVERLQDISEADAQAEGVDAYAKAYCSRRPEDELTTVGYYELLWDSLNGKKYPWASNPWVWVVEFRYIRPTLPLI